MRLLRRSSAVFRCVLLALTVAGSAIAQTDSGTVSGRVVDPSGLSIAGAQISLISIDQDTRTSTTTNGAGLYTFHGVRPGRYRIEVSAPGFKVVNVTGLVVNTQANLEQNFALSIGSVSESITVEAKANDISTSVSTVVDRQFVENLPLNGRSFQSLMQLTPGVVVTPTTDTDSGQFSVNGQRASANYFTVDGVSANIGASSNNFSTQNASGAIPGFSVLGGSNNLVSADAVQEFRVQTSTYAPEFGRTPGAQVSIETRSGTNQFHGTAFEYLRNDVLDAGDWFNGTTNPPLKKSKERQNDFGGVLGGPIVPNRTFFFVSYEGQILRLPQTGISKVPALSVRQDPTTPAAILPLLNAFPLPNQQASADDVANGVAPFVAGSSDQSTLNATSFRIDHRVTDRLQIFGRYNNSPSNLLTRGNGSTFALNNLVRFAIDTQTLTLGAVWSPGPRATNDFRMNYSRNRASGRFTLDSFGGAVVPPENFFLPAPFTSANAQGSFAIFSAGSLQVGPITASLQRQLNLVDSFSLQEGAHALKFGVDYRRLTPQTTPPVYSLGVSFLDVPSAVSLQPLDSTVASSSLFDVRFMNLGAYVQDTWKVSPRLTVTYGARWDVDFSPSVVKGPDFLALTNISNPDATAVAPAGTPLFNTRYANVAPRIGVAYMLSSVPKRETVLKGGFGVFYDLATQQVGDIFSLAAIFPFGSSRVCPFDPACGVSSLSFPLPSSLTQPPPIVFNPSAAVQTGVDPHLQLPYVLQWSVAMQQSMGDKQSLSVSYVGSAGRRLIQQALQLTPNNPVFSLGLELIENHATSDYDALQLQYQRQLAKGLQALGSYVWSHSLDTASSSSITPFNTFSPGQSSNSDRGPSDFDVRHAFSAGVTYSIPAAASQPGFVRAVTGGWSVDSMMQARTATPVNVFSTAFGFLGNSLIALRPDVVPGQPFYLKGAECSTLPEGICPGGKALNPQAFVAPPVDPVTQAPLRQGDLPRNALRGFGAFQWDLAARREFSLKESLKLEFKAELFNILNHPNFANPSGDLTSSSFGVSTSMLNRGLSAGQLGSGGFSPLYQIGGPRSTQLAMKLKF